MLGPGALLFAAAGAAEAPATPDPVINTASKTTPTLPASCTPSEDREVTITYTASNVEAGDQVRIRRLIDGGVDATVTVEALKSSDSIVDLWDRKDGSDETVALSYRVEALRGGDSKSSKTTSASNHDVSVVTCPT